MDHKITFKRDGKVLVNGIVVGTVSAPDRSGAAWSRTPMWKFNDFTGKPFLARSRSWLSDDIISASIRLAKAA